MISFKVGHVVLLAGGTVALYLLFSRLAHSRPSPPPSTTGPPPEHPASEDPTYSARHPPGVRLSQVFPPPESSTKTDVDIIAIHGLDTKSPDTWIWDPKGAHVNWLGDSDMLPRRFPTARIFTCDWPADLFEQPDFIQKTIEEFARLLLAGIKNRPPATNDQRRKGGRPTVFIASCLGGVILMKALVMASCEYLSVRKAARGIVFLATPFRGTSFQDVAKWAEPGLRTWASTRGKKVSNLLEQAKSTFDLGELVRDFTALCQDENVNLTDCVFTFYETGNSSLPRKIAPWLPDSLSQVQPLVNQSSATPDFVRHPLPLDRPHVLMNKFRSPECPEYKSVADIIEEIVRKVYAGTPLEQADALIRDEHYTEDRLKIERLSGDLLPMDQCYINLAVVEQSGQDASRSKEGDPAPPAISLLARQKAETPDETIQVELATIFNKRKDCNGREIQPRRILIRGRAGVGKTTLCKKMVHDFTRVTQTELHRSWTELFDRLLWVPLRNLKKRSGAGYNHEHMFYHEFFSSQGQDDGYRLAKELWRELRDTSSNRTLFLLDGLDEISQELGRDDDMARFIRDLLDRPNLIITSRPNASLPPGLRNPDLELETIGFYPDQVTAYLKANSKRADEVQSFLQKHSLIQGLTRIPIQLDALSCIWDDFKPGTVPDTMTGIYTAIEQSLWKKDAVRLGIVENAKDFTPVEVESKVQSQIELLGCLAFSGLYSDIIDFTSTHRSEIAKRFLPQLDSLKLPLGEILARISFLRTSDPSSKVEDRNYHFLHLTFQEYFAARYFVQQWTDHKQLEFIFKGEQRTRSDPPTDPAEFLRRNKYSAHYDVFWRFVAGLLEDQGKCEFFKLIEEEPLDLLGPTHQRLVMHCLSEVDSSEVDSSEEDSSMKMPIRSELKEIRSNLEERLSRWVLFECQHTGNSQLVREMEFPQQLLDDVLKQARKEARTTLLESLKYRPAIPLSTVDLAASWLGDNMSQDVTLAILGIFSRPSALSDKVVQAIAERLGDKDPALRRAAVEALGSQQGLSDKVLQAIAERLGDKDPDVRRAAVDALIHQQSLPSKVLEWLTTNGESYLAVGHKDVRWEGWSDCARNTIQEKQEELGAPHKLPSLVETQQTQTTELGRSSRGGRRE